MIFTIKGLLNKKNKGGEEDYFICVKFISQVSLIKNIYDYYTQFRKFEYFLKLKKYSQKKKSISDFANDLSSAFDDIKLKEKKIVLSKICKYLVNIKLLKLLDKIRINRNKEVKQ